MLKQTEIDFKVHESETNFESQLILQNNRDRFSKDCQRVYDMLMNGFKGTVWDMKCDRSRISDLKRNGVKLSFEKSGRFRLWYMSEADKGFNKSKFNNC